MNGSARNRYQWSVDSPPEFFRIVASARTALKDPLGLDLAAEVVKYGEARLILGGATATQGAPANTAYERYHFFPRRSKIGRPRSLKSYGRGQFNRKGK